jgi:hypothetical protein
MKIYVNIQYLWRNENNGGGSMAALSYYRLRKLIINVFNG